PFSLTDTPTTPIFTLSLHDALPICKVSARRVIVAGRDSVEPLLNGPAGLLPVRRAPQDYSSARWLARRFCPRRRLSTLFVHFVRDRKSTRLNSSHRTISYAVFCLKK